MFLLCLTIILEGFSFRRIAHFAGTGRRPATGRCYNQQRLCARELRSAVATCRGFSVARVASMEQRRWHRTSTCHLPVNDASYLLGILEACNNNVAYAYACVKLGLQKFIVSESAPLHEAAKSFAMLVHRKGSLATLMALMQNDAPRFLGKTFAA